MIFQMLIFKRKDSVHCLSFFQIWYRHSFKFNLLLADFSKLGGSIQVMNSRYWNGLTGYLGDAQTKRLSPRFPPSVTNVSLLQSLGRLNTAFCKQNFIRNTAIGLEVGLLSEFDGCGDSAEMTLLVLKFI